MSNTAFTMPGSDVVVPAPVAQTAQQRLNQARAEHLAGNLDVARQQYDTALQEAPGDPELLHLRGALAWQLGQLDEAAALVEQALVHRPDFATALNTFGVIAQSQNRQREAANAFAKALALSPRAVGYAANLAASLFELGDNDQAVAQLQALARRAPDSASAHRALGDGLLRAGDAVRAIDSYREALARAPTDGEIRFALAHALQVQGNPEAAIDHYEAILAQQPSHARALQNLGRAYSDTGDAAKGLDCLQRALRAAPKRAEAWGNVAVALRRRGEIDAALAHYAAAIEVEPDDARTRYHHALTLLLAGEFDRGWREHEHRMNVESFPIRRDFPAHTRWNGGPLAGQSLLLHAEQGLGDTLQFVRYAALIGLNGLAHGGRITLMVQPALVPLVTGVAGVDRVVGSDAPPPPHDVQAPMLSLPMLLGTTAARIPAAVPYLHARDDLRQHWRERLGTDGLRVGLVWAGNPAHGNDRERSLPPATIQDFATGLLAMRADIRLFGLQVGARSHELDALEAGARYRNMAPALGDFSQTAAALAELDLLVSVDTSAAHLAGALARPVALILPFAPDWRWMLKGCTTPWYPTMRLCRATTPGDIGGALIAARTAVAGFRPGFTPWP